MKERNKKKAKLVSLYLFYLHVFKDKLKFLRMVALVLCFIHTIRPMNV